MKYIQFGNNILNISMCTSAKLESHQGFCVFNFYLPSGICISERWETERTAELRLPWIYEQAGVQVQEDTNREMDIVTPKILKKGQYENWGNK